MKKLLLAAALTCGMLSAPASAGIGKYFDAIKVANYEVCGERLRHVDGYKLKALKMRERGKDIGADRIGEKNFIKAILSQKPKAREFSLRKCKNIATRVWNN